MKPLTPNESQKLLLRTQNFEDAEITSIDFINPTELTITINTQDKNRDFDWICIVLYFIGICDAKLVQNSSLIDMSEGLSFVYEEGKIFFGVGQYENSNAIKDSVLFVESNSVKIEEKPFS